MKIKKVEDKYYVHAQDGFVDMPKPQRPLWVKGLGKLIVHPRLTKKGHSKSYWSVTEPITGLAIANGRYDYVGVVNRAKQLVKLHGVSKINKQIIKCIKKGPISPRYQKVD